MNINRIITGLFIKNIDNTNNPRVRQQCGYLASGVSIVVNILIFIFKFIFGTAANSISLIADSIHTLSDVLTSIIVLFSFKISYHPADKEHPFGHGRMEHVASLVLAVLLFAVGIHFFNDALLRFVRPQAVTVNAWVIIGLGLSIILKEWMTRFTLYLSKKIDAAVLEADAWHHRSDAVTSVLVFIALFGAKNKLFKIDAIFGILIALLIIYIAWRIAKKAVNLLLGQSVDEAVIGEIEKCAYEVPGVEGVHDIKVHNYGTFNAISLHVEVDKGIDMIRAQDIAGLVERSIAGRFFSSPVVRIDLRADCKKKNISADRHLNIGRIISKHKNIIGFHAINMFSTDRGSLIDLHIIVDRNMSIETAHQIEHAVSDEIKQEFIGYQVNIHVEPGT
ncbi:MAG: cation-efflux pump [Candidatus Omnitrophota bacterium]